jgi:hypothetical protein
MQSINSIPHALWSDIKGGWQCKDGMTPSPL